MNLEIKKKIEKYDKFKLTLIGIILAITILIFRKGILSLLLATVLFLLALISPAYKRFIPLQSLGFELITFTFIIFSFAYSPLIGWLAIFILVPTAYLYFSGKFNPIAVITKYALFGIIAAIFPVLESLGIITAGIIIVIVYNVILRIIGLFIGLDPISFALSLIFNIILNSYLIINLGEKLIKIM